MKERDVVRRTVVRHPSNRIPCLMVRPARRQKAIAPATHPHAPRSCAPSRSASALPTPAAERAAFPARAGSVVARPDHCRYTPTTPGKHPRGRAAYRLFGFGSRWFTSARALTPQVQGNVAAGSELHIVMLHLRFEKKRRTSSCAIPLLCFWNRPTPPRNATPSGATAGPSAGSVDVGGDTASLQENGSTLPRAGRHPENRRTLRRRPQVPRRRRYVAHWPR